MNKDQTNAVLVGLLGLAVGYGIAYAIASSKNQSNAVNPFAASQPTGGSAGVGLTGQPSQTGANIGQTSQPGQSQGFNPMSLL